MCLWRWRLVSVQISLPATFTSLEVLICHGLSEEQEAAVRLASQWQELHKHLRWVYSSCLSMATRWLSVCVQFVTRENVRGDAYVYIFSLWQVKAPLMRACGFNLPCTIYIVPHVNEIRAYLLRAPAFLVPKHISACTNALGAANWEVSPENVRRMLLVSQRSSLETSVTFYFQNKVFSPDWRRIYGSQMYFWKYLKSFIANSF